jgi:nucleoside-diphosphate-sugar epimerase
MNIILTGVTGTLGSQTLLELLKNETIENFFLLIRDKKNLSAQQRLQRIIESDVFSTQTEVLSNLRQRVQVFNPEEFFNPSKYLLIKNENYFIHSAGYVNLSTDISQKELIFEENFSFAKKIFETFHFYIKKFTYISTAFAIGDIGGQIENNYHNNIVPNYRNAYEESKHKTEKYLLEEGRKNNIQIQILRPSVIGGNIINKPLNYISKFMVYYLVGKFFYKNPLLENNDMRLSVNFKAGLNIIPVDYVAKVIAKAFLKNIQELNIVHNKCTNLVTGLTRIIETVGYKEYSFLDNVSTYNIQNMNKLEQFYYSSIGNHLSPYTLSKPYEFNTELLEKIHPMPNYNLEDYLGETIKHAANNNFRNEKW